MPTQIEIRGQLVDFRYVIVSAVWVACVLIFWPIVVVSTRRAYLAYKHSLGKLSSSLVCWTHLLACQAFLTVIAVDSTTIVFDVWGTISLVCLLEVTTIITSIFLFTFANSIQVFAVESTLNRPQWISTFKRFIMIFNFLAANALLVSHILIDRVYTSAFVPLLIGTEAALVAPSFFWIVHRLCSRLERQHTRSTHDDNSDDTNSVAELNREHSQRILDGVRKFRRHTIVSCGIMVTFATVVVIFYVPRLLEDKDLIYSNNPVYTDFSRNRSFRTSFRFVWISWLALAFYAYLLRRHWISLDSAAGRSFRRFFRHASDPAQAPCWTPQRFNELVPPSNRGTPSSAQPMVA